MMAGVERLAQRQTLLNCAGCKDRISKVNSRPSWWQLQPASIALAVGRHGIHPVEQKTHTLEHKEGDRKTGHTLIPSSTRQPIHRRKQRNFEQKGTKATKPQPKKLKPHAKTQRRKGTEDRQDEFEQKEPKITKFRILLFCLAQADQCLRFFFAPLRLALKYYARSFRFQRAREASWRWWGLNTLGRSPYFGANK
jgi:hypothetical protein